MAPRHRVAAAGKKAGVISALFQSDARCAST
jgi:hypothetical protein